MPTNSGSCSAFSGGPLIGFSCSHSAPVKKTANENADADFESPFLFHLTLEKRSIFFQKWNGGKRRPRMAAEKKKESNGGKKKSLADAGFRLIFSTVYDWKLLAMALSF
ncbi:hypothetical protein CEXT_199401 [Caerostris extrusa]|uniref:Uncharacterized protein n=1 Tax=Caerostris extrusa TaxID=172846 RepID=A0AAV4WT83_CAEEX|nr:hypothetical protein CEXT_199401 [Caerostris extrusa]